MDIYPYAISPTMPRILREEWDIRRVIPKHQGLEMMFLYLDISTS
jgi:hypothetical protein